MNGSRLLARQVGHYALPLVAGILLLLVTVGGELSLPLLIGQGLFDRVLVQRDLAELHRVLLWTVLVYLARALTQFGSTYLTSYAGQRAVADLRARLHDHLQGLSIAYLQRQRVGDQVSRITSDLTVIQNALTPGLSELVRNAATLVGTTVVLFSVHWKLAALAFLILPVAGGAVELYGRLIRRYTREVQERIADVAGILHESLSAIRVVKAFTVEEQQRRRFARSNEQGFHAAMKSTQVMATVSPVVELLMLGAMAVVVYMGAREVLTGRITMGQLVAFLSYLGMVSGPVSSIGRIYTQMQQGVAAADRAAEILRQAPEAVQGPGAVELVPERVRGAVEFRNVSFRYEDGGIEALHGVNLRVEPGEVVAVVGPSGAGKTTLVSLLPRFFDPTEGAVLLDGRDLRSVELGSLRRLVAVVPQDTVLFRLSVAENIAIGRPGASRRQIEEAATLANAAPFIERLPEGYDTVLGDLGAGLSGGERQRLAIARAMLRDPRILILDEATSSLDAQSEALVQEALARLMKGRTTFIVAHRLSTISRADRIVVMEAGRVVEIGSHDELMARAGLYSRLYRLQAVTA
ncbi:MAG: ABC transporter ATP-binding protein [Limnochordaceae bacterium]|uniref:ABC transporter ATP-binding protein n=1 Tax=Carboxydichorda subterranea TaxID=3109565 RepID=A0ABZ1BW57_9FIRM|nr:ABC transporter ATP-binding protein [Limnochorda sp. L945t]MBE3599421.1 ABC transporter ATP-binding protein [Limnochordaceae bacterium]WRP16898.1 ABC transporter ATP-binding protein [Limnochorda sp. L945t]